MGRFITWYIMMLVCGALIGLIPFGLGKYLDKPHLGQLGLILCSVSALLHPALPLAIAVAFVIGMCIAKNDIRINRNDTSFFRASEVRGNRVYSIQLYSIAGPLKGRVYSIGSAGLTIGRDGGCAVRLPDSTPGISRCHCSIRFHQGQLALVDLNSAYGTYMGDGTRLPPNYPMQLGAGSRFYLGSPNVLFEIRYR